MKVKFCRELETSLNVLEMLKVFTYYDTDPICLHWTGSKWNGTVPYGVTFISTTDQIQFVPDPPGPV